MKNLKVSMKLLVAFGVVVAIIIAISFVSIVNLLSVDSKYTLTLDTQSMPLNPAINAYGAIHGVRADSRLFPLYTGNKDKVREIRKSMDAWIKEFEDSAANFRRNVFQPEIAKMYEDAMKAYQETFKPGVYKLADDAEKGVSTAELMAYIESVTDPSGINIANAFLLVTDKKMEQLLKASDECTDLSERAVTIMVVLLIVSVLIALFFGIYISGLISKPLGEAVKMIIEMGRGHLGGRLRLNRDDEIGILAKTMDSFADDMQNVVIGTMKKISVGDLSTKIDLKDPYDEISAALKGTIDELHALIIDDGGKVLTAAANKDLSQRLKGNYNGAYSKMKENINTVVQSLDEALSQVSEAVGQVSSASSQISGGAQSLAEGASTQASSLEEVSASLEEMSSMTKQNADNSNHAKILATEAKAAANEGDVSMKKMADAIREIKTSSDNTAKIIKTIDDIAFQTNLLALNAAVEAARAGEAGKGFAVVAEEVRNLAMRSAEAAKNTANMIEESVKNADGGVKITEEVAKSLGQIVDRTQTVGDLIAEIAAASNEQALGIEQVNTAVASMNQVTQQNAANSEESASASEELSSQAAELANMVNEFKLSVGNSGGMGARRSLPPPRPQQRPAVAALPNKSATATAIASKSAKAVKSSEVIPLDDDELGEF
jgi:methyl-accepting chemotaxis protein